MNQNIDEETEEIIGIEKELNKEVSQETRQLKKYESTKTDFKSKYALKQWFKNEYFDLTPIDKIVFHHPSAYDVLACLQSYDIGSFEDFCSEFGYDTDSRKAEKTYKAVLNEWNNIKMLYSDSEIRALQEVN